MSTVHIEYGVTSLAGFVDVMVHEFSAEHLSVVLLLYHVLFYVGKRHVIRQRVVPEIYKPAKNSVLFSKVLYLGQAVDRN